MAAPLSILLAVTALALLATTRNARAGKLNALRNAVQAGHQRTLTAAGRRRLTASSVLPRSLMRNLHLLGIEPDLRGIGAALAAGLLMSGTAGILFGFLVTLALAGAALMVGLAVLNVLAARRVTELGALLPGFFDRVRQLLIVGNSLPTAFTRSVQGAPPRLRQFFASAVRRMGNGASFSESIAQCTDDIGLYEMRLFAAAVATNMRFGGSLTHSLGNLISYLRKRASIEREMRASTTQIRVSAWVLGLLPMMVAGLIIFQNPDYASWFISHPTGKRMLAYCIVSQFAGVFVMRLVTRTSF